MPVVVCSAIVQLVCVACSSLLVAREIIEVVCVFVRIDLSSSFCNCSSFRNSLCSSFCNSLCSCFCSSLGNSLCGTFTCCVRECKSTIAVVNERECNLNISRNIKLVGCCTKCACVKEFSGIYFACPPVSHIPVGVRFFLNSNIGSLCECSFELTVNELVIAHIFCVFLTGIVSAVDPAEEIICLIVGLICSCLGHCSCLSNCFGNGLCNRLCLDNSVAAARNCTIYGELILEIGIYNGTVDVLIIVIAILRLIGGQVIIIDLDCSACSLENLKGNLQNFSFRLVIPSTGRCGEVAIYRVILLLSLFREILNGSGEFLLHSAAKSCHGSSLKLCVVEIHPNFTVQDCVIRLELKCKFKGIAL